MDLEKGKWVLKGSRQEDPRCIHTWQQLVHRIDEIGFLPLFQNGIPGFSVEEHTAGCCWWSGDPRQDPWEWRQLRRHFPAAKQAALREALGGNW